MRSYASLTCSSGHFLNNITNSCDECSCGVRDSKCIERNICLECDINQAFDLNLLQCVDACSDQDEKATIPFHPYLKRQFKYCRQLGTLQYPFKSMVSALVELFNYLQADKKPYEILIKEGEQEKLYGLQKHMQQWIQINQEISQSQIFKLAKLLPINYILDFPSLILNSTIVTDYINEGIILLSDCSQRQINSYEGEIEFSGLRVVGQRYLVIQQPLIYIQTLYNVTVDNSELRSFSSINDASKQQLSIESTSLCPFNADKKIKKTQLTNSYISSDAINGKDQTQIQYNINCGQRSDFNKRIQQCIIENLTFENLYSGVTLLYLSQGASDLTMRNFTQNNVSLGPIQAMHYFITGFTTLYMIDIKFYNCETQGRVIATGIFTNTYIDKLVMINNTCKDFNSNLNSIDQWINRKMDYVSLRVLNVLFNLYGKIMRSANPLNLRILNSTIVTDYINEGIILLSDCSQRQINSYEGEIEFSGLRVVGQRYLIMQQPLIYIQTLNNVTIDNSELRSFSSINDANKQQLLIESTRLCPFNADQKVKKTQLTNSYISSDAINGKDQSQIQYSISCRQSSDLNKRIQQCIIENLTFENLYSGVTLLSLSQGSSDLTMRNITQNNVSLDIKFYNCETQGRVLATGIFTFTYIEKLVMINNTLDKEKNGLCFFKSSANPTNAIYSFNNLYFKNNNIYSNQSMIIQLYTDNSKFGAYIVRYDEYNLANLSENSTIENVTISNNEVDFFFFGGFKNTSLTNRDIIFQLSLNRLNFTSNMYVKESNLIKIDQFADESNAQIILNNSFFTNNTFEAGGNLLLASQNQRLPLIIQNTVVTQNYQAQFHFQAGDIMNKNLPQSSIVKNCSFSQNYQMILSIFDMKENTKIQIYSSTFQDNLSMSRGAVILADY
ncbi:UNKNOWN [Stylonychia lemnae]|uniref:Uncharacterized protein n=1 Tax=Stylonychia lemnae TaxID=5949 RepID=A0A078A4M3_STYLE|nr:UNKNOWN [Stylonychia lemnae]|eukprot:CDW77117.1 UNKNOWN [Stylonychia lemnae]